MKTREETYVAFDEDQGITRVLNSAYLKHHPIPNPRLGQNTFTSYTIESIDDFFSLISEEQRLFIMQAGLNTVEQARIYAFMRERKFFNEVIDTKELLNKAPAKRS